MKALHGSLMHKAQHKTETNGSLWLISFISSKALNIRLILHTPLLFSVPATRCWQASVRGYWCTVPKPTRWHLEVFWQLQLNTHPCSDSRTWGSMEGLVQHDCHTQTSLLWGTGSVLMVVSLVSLCHRMYPTLLTYLCRCKFWCDADGPAKDARLTVAPSHGQVL